jgi:4'-phosphopantetheinyl transferase
MALRILPRSRQTEAFFACWTLKEAYLKARGVGLRVPLNQFAVTLAPDQSAALLFDATDRQAASLWSLQSLDVGEDFAAALAVEGQGWRLRRWLWTGEDRL